MTAEEDPGAMPEASGAALASGYIPHPASERAEVLQAELAAKPLTRYIDEAVADLEENKEGSGKYVTPAYRFALEKLRKNLSAIKPYREAVEATAKAVLDRETREIERQQQRAMEMLQQEEAEIQAHLEYQAKMLEAKAADEKRQQVEIRRIENVYAGEMKKITQEKQSIEKEAEYDIEEEQIRLEAEKDRLTRETTALIDDLLHDFESWKTQQMLGMHSKQAEIWERSAAAKEELAADLDELKGKIEYHEGEIMKVKIACSGAEALVAKRLDELEAARKSAGAAFRLSDTASLSFRPQEERLAEVRSKRIKETEAKEAIWRAKEAMIKEEDARKRREAQERFDKCSTEHKDLIESHSKEIDRLQARAAKELDLLGSDLQASRGRLEEATSAALEAREALARKEKELAETEKAAQEKVRQMKEQNITDGRVNRQTFEVQRNAAESQFILRTEEMKAAVEKERESLLEVREQMVEVAKQKANRERISLDREYQTQEKNLKEVYQEIGYARAQIEDQQEFIKDNSERYSRRTAAREEKQQARSAEFRAIMEALQREQVQAASEADKAADLAKMGMRSEERLRAIAEQEVAVRAGWVNLQAMATARASELTDQFRSDRQNDSQAAALSKAAAEESVAKADQEVGKLMQTMGQRGKLIRSGIGAVDAYSTVLKRTEQCLVADREFVASEVAAGDAALNHFEAEVNAALARKEAEAKEAKEESAEEVAAEEKAVRAAAEERRAALELHRAVADASLKALRGHLEAIRERMQHEETAAEAAEAEAQALEENVSREIAGIESEGSNAHVEHIPGVALSAAIRVDAARCRLQEARLRAAVLRSSCSPLGSLKAQEFMLGERVKEAEEDLSRREGRLAGQKERAERALEAKRRAHEALCLCIDEEMEEERRHARETVASRKRRAEDRKQSLEKGWNDSQETLSDIISGGAAAAKVLAGAAQLYGEDEDANLRAALRSLASAKMSLDLVGLDSAERDMRGLESLEEWCKELSGEVSTQQAAVRAKAASLNDMRRVSLARAVEKRKMEELYAVAGQKASAVAAEQQRQKAAHAEEAEESSAAASEFEEQQRESERLLAAARQRLEEALRSAAVEEGKMVSLKERYEEVMVRLDTELEAARLHGRDRLAAVEAEMEAIKETRERTVGDINAEEAAWRDRTANKDRYMRELEEANAVGIKRLQDDVESMRQFVVVADDAVLATQTKEAEEMRRRQAESADAQAHYKSKTDALSMEIDSLLGQPQVEFDTAMALLVPDTMARQSEISDEREEFSAVCALYLEEEKMLEEQIQELRHEAADILKKAEEHKAQVEAAEKALSEAKTELEAQKGKYSQAELQNKRALNVFEADALKAANEIDQIDADVKLDVEELQRSVHDRIAEREAEALKIRDEKMEKLNAKLKVMVDEFGKFKMGKLENVKVQIERLSEGEWEAEQEMTEAMEKVANLAAERGQARKQAMKEQAEARAAIREVQREKDQEEALAYEEEMQMMLEDLETMARALRKGEEMHRIALEEEQVRERARVEEVTRAELQVELRKKQEEARQLFEYEKARMRKEAEELAAAAEAELHEEEEKALSALRARRKERLKVVEAKRAELRRKLEDSFVEKQMKLKEEHLEKEQEKLTLVSRTFGFFGKKKKNRPSSADKLRGQVSMASDLRPESPDEQSAWEEKKAMERELAKLEAEMQALRAVSDI